MKKAEFKELMDIYDNNFCEDTPEFFAIEIVKKIMSSKAGDCTKLVLLRHYMNNISTNEAVIENARRYEEF